MVVQPAPGSFVHTMSSSTFLSAASPHLLAVPSTYFHPPPRVNGEVLDLPLLGPTR